MDFSSEIINGIEILTLQNKHLKCRIAPSLGGKVVSLFNKKLNREFLWTNSNLGLNINQPGDDYDSNFVGGIDELIPNDLAETINGTIYPDHGELWTCQLEYIHENNQLRVHGLLPLSQLYYSRTLSLDPHSPTLSMHYEIKNKSATERDFLWKMHAALRITAGDRMISDAAEAQVVDPHYSRFQSTVPFRWPAINGVDAGLVPDKSDTMDFLYLYDIKTPEQKMLAADGSLFVYRYDGKVFPYQWYFASYGGFLDHYVAILEPCTSMPISVNDAKQKGQCTSLQPGEQLNTTVTIFAGNKNDYASTN